MKETILKYFQEIKANIEKDLDKAVKVRMQVNQKLIDSWTTGQKSITQF